MAFGKIPRFSPSFSLQEAVISARYLAQDGPNDEVVGKFEKRFAEYIGAKHAVMTPSARYGFFLLLEALGIGAGDEVIVPALTYYAIPAMVPLTGATPVFADTGLRTHVLDPESFEAAITPNTKAVVPTHLFGTPCDMDAINAIAKANDIAVIEDCAQSTGARYKGQRVGGLGDHAYYTFGLTKNITTLSGAMITTDDPKIAQHAREKIDAGGYTDKAKSRQEAVTGLAMMIATHPLVYPFALHPVIRLGNKFGKDPIHERFGEPEHIYESLPQKYLEQSRALAVNAAVGMKQLDRSDDLNGARVRNGRSLDQGLAHVAGLTVPDYADGAEPIYMSFVVHHRDREGLATALRRRGVDTTIGYMNDHSSSHIFRDYANDCPNAKESMDTLLHIPVHPNLREKDLDHMIEAVRSACLELG